MNDLTLRNVRIIFRNFAGAPTRFNAAGGKRTFSILLNETEANELRSMGFNVKALKQRDPDDDPAFHLPVEVSYRVKPPRIVFISNQGRKRTVIDEDTVGLIDYTEIEKIDLTINPYQWEMENARGVKAYLRTMYVTIREDELDIEYAQDFGPEVPADYEE
jgi:hypothetical protein|nr:MAG TPA: hypothetical protein [Caudoviricetes sp.]